ncbi:hypothetical protein [Massilia sp. Leaf139]|uniref:hypothetical protein n=1 Tax=Massilia sp. Leaf139 TaxID=1736272 RepID=UPI0006F1E0D4|nr:hypothetical protein [Massilia sp. Leaf139]KQQ89261.1 hypothetical protein ASF77_11500 [Massilia sp. Leaf139]
MPPSARRLLLTASLLAAGLPLPGLAFTPPPPPVCALASDAVTTAALEATILGASSWPEHQCAMIALIKRGEPAVPVAVRLLGMDDDHLYQAVEIVTALGPRAHAALPALMSRIRDRPPALVVQFQQLYGALASLGPAARPAIPFLIEKSREPAHRDSALGALGKLWKFEPRLVVPHLTAMLEGRQEKLSRDDTISVLFALAEARSEARAALPGALAAIEQAKASGDAMLGMAALRALAAIAEPAQSVPILSKLLAHPVLGDHAVTELGNIGRPAASAVPLLKARLERTGDPVMRAIIAGSLAAIAGKGAG